MLIQWEKEHPSRIESIFTALQNVSPSQLADTQLFDFETLAIDRSGERKEYEFDLNQSESNNKPLNLVLSNYNINELKPLLEKFNQETIDRLSHGESIDIRLVLKEES